MKNMIQNRICCYTNGILNFQIQKTTEQYKYKEIEQQAIIVESKK